MQSINIPAGPLVILPVHKKVHSNLNGVCCWDGESAKKHPTQACIWLINFKCITGLRSTCNSSVVARLRCLIPKTGALLNVWEVPGPLRRMRHIEQRPWHTDHG